MKISNRFIAISMLLAIVLAGGATWTLASHDDNVIHACVRVGGGDDGDEAGDDGAKGQVRIVASADECKSNEVPVEWNRVGPTGEQGPKGDPGDVVKAAPPCFDLFNRYVDCGNGTVMDTVTGLLWLKNANCVEFTSQSYPDANDAAAGLEHGECGLTDNSSPGDWRLPTKAEWEATVAQANVLGCSVPSLTDTTGTKCFAAGSPFVNVQSSSYYWSSSSYEADPRAAWDVYLHSGSVPPDGKSFIFFVWPVRGGQ